MKDGLIAVGETRQHTFVVRPEDVASFQGETVHDVCATYTLAREIEYASRLFVLELKEEQEEGIGTELTVRHISPAFPGETVTIVATLDTLTDRDVICSYVARVGDRVVARGTTGQKVLPRERIRALFEHTRKGDH